MLRGNQEVALAAGDRSYKLRKLFLEQLEKGWSESRAAKAAGRSVSFFKRWAEEDVNFKKDWEDADSAGTDRLEDAATKRALKGSDQLLVHQLRARRPQKHREKPPELNVSVNNDFSAVDLDLERKIAKATSEDQSRTKAVSAKRADVKPEA